MNEFIITEYPVYSKKYDVHGVIKDSSFWTMLEFKYEDNLIEFTVARPFPQHDDEVFQKLGEETIDTYIEKLVSGEIIIPKCMLYYWYVDKRTDLMTGEVYLKTHGRVTGHRKFQDSVNIHTSDVQEIIINEEEGEAIIRTKNTKYHCPLMYMNFEKQEKFAELIQDYEKLKEKYKDKMQSPSIDPGNVLLVLSNFDEYYFNSLYYVPEGETERIEYYATAHTGMFQDSFLIEDKGWKYFDIRYFPHYRNVEFYGEDTKGKPFFVENIGNVVLYVQAFCGTIKLEPGDRKEVREENCEKDVTSLPGGDLYPARLIV